MFGLEIWHIWAIVALICIILEIFTAGFAVMCFSFGAIAAAICSACGLGLVWQLVAFSVLTALAFIFVRPFVLKHINKPQDEVKTNANALIGRVGRVTEKIDNAANTGRMAIDGDDWKAVAKDNQVFEVGQQVKIVSRDSVILTVEAI